MYAGRERIRQKGQGEPFDTSARVRPHRKEGLPRCKYHRPLRRLFPIECPCLRMSPDPSRICSSPDLSEQGPASSFPARPVIQAADLIAALFRSIGGIDRKFSL